MFSQNKSAAWRSQQNAKAAEANSLGCLVRTKGLEPPRRETPDPKSGAATITPRAHFRLQSYNLFPTMQNKSPKIHGSFFSYLIYEKGRDMIAMPPPSD